MSEQLKAAIEAVEASNTPKPADIPETPAEVPGAATPAAQAETDDDQGEENETDESAASDGTDAPARPKNKGVGKRINELTKDKHDAIREREYWREEAERLRSQVHPQQSQPTQAAPSSTGKPQIEDFDFDQSAWAEALTEWTLDQRIQKSEITQRHRAFAEKEAAFVADHPDYADVAKAPHVPITQSMAEAIYEADDPPAIAYYLGQNLDEATAIAGMSPIAAARAIGRIEAQLTRAPATPANNIPSPPRTVTSAPAVAANVSARAPVAKPTSGKSVDDFINDLRVKSSR